MSTAVKANYRGVQHKGASQSVKEENEVLQPALTVYLDKVIRCIAGESKKRVERTIENLTQHIFKVCCRRFDYYAE